MSDKIYLYIPWSGIVSSCSLIMPNNNELMIIYFDGFGGGGHRNLGGADEDGAIYRSFISQNNGQA